MMSLDFVRAINASKKFKIKDKFEFIEFNDVSDEASTPEEPVPDQLEIWAGVKIFYDGEIPESYKALNLILGDWVETNEEALTEVIHNKLTEHLDKNYPDSSYDLTDDTSIWMDQLDYMPVENEGEKSLTIEIELVLHAEPEEDD